MTPREEGQQAFANKQSKNSCPYEGEKAVEWKLGYTQQEYEEVKRERNKILADMGRFSDPRTQLGEIIRDLRNKINQYQDDLSRSRTAS